jgi:hypothetical protein
MSVKNLETAFCYRAVKPFGEHYVTLSHCIILYPSKQSPVKKLKADISILKKAAHFVHRPTCSLSSDHCNQYQRLS